MQRFAPAALSLALVWCLLVVDPGAGQGQRQLLKTDGWGSLAGRILYRGMPPAPKDLTAVMQGHADKACCLDAKAKAMEKQDNTWVVDPQTKGVADVLVFLKPPAGTYFPIHDDDTKREDTVVLDQPHCMFLPRMSAFYPVYFDGAKHVPTGQQFEVKNSATVPHNTRAIGNPAINPGFNFILAPGTARMVELKPQPIPLVISCDIHPWMGARVGIFERPYFAITKTDGRFTIPRVPAGGEVIFMGYHEVYIEGKDGRKITLTKGENKLPDIEISAKP